jgi:16S rRNA (guanine966-N2)-methyltransferase
MSNKNFHQLRNLFRNVWGGSDFVEESPKHLYGRNGGFFGIELTVKSSSKCRVIFGSLKRSVLCIPNCKTTRPTSDIVKESIFSVLIHRFNVDFENAIVFDLFAGSGAFGIEAISLGCKRVVFVDNDKTAIQCISGNLEKLKIKQFALLIHCTVENLSNNFFAKLTTDYDKTIFFMDPPYIDKTLLSSQLARISKLFEHKRTLFVVESDDHLMTHEENIHPITHGRTVTTIINQL